MYDWIRWTNDTHSPKQLPLNKLWEFFYSCRVADVQATHCMYSALIVIPRNHMNSSFFSVFFSLKKKSYNQLSSPSSWPPFTHTRDTLFCPKHLIFPQILHVSINLHLIFYVSSCWCVYMFTKHSQHKYVSFHYSIFPSHLTNIAINSVCFFFGCTKFRWIFFPVSRRSLFSLLRITIVIALVITIMLTPNGGEAQQKRLMYG